MAADELFVVSHFFVAFSPRIVWLLAGEGLGAGKPGEVFIAVLAIDRGELAAGDGVEADDGDEDEADADVDAAADADDVEDKETGC